MVADVKVKVGDKVSRGSPILVLDSDAAPKAESASQATGTIEVRVPDIGDFKDVPIVEVLVKAGDRVKKNDSLVTLESDKASMEVPAEADGVITDVKVKVGDKVSQGSTILLMSSQTAQPIEETAQQPVLQHPVPQQPASTQGPSPPPAPPASTGDGLVHASPAIRRFARELGVNLRAIARQRPEWPHHARRRAELRQDGAPKHEQRRWRGLSRASPVAEIGFRAIRQDRAATAFAHQETLGTEPPSELGLGCRTSRTTTKPTSRRSKRSETKINAEQGKSGGPKLTMLAFLIRASVSALQRFPEFNASLDGEELILKRYYNVGFAADTPGGLVVPVIKNADTKGLIEIAREAQELAGKAREGKLTLAQMQGGSFTISSIGGIGGTAFTQIVNAPEVAILGATRTATKPVWDGKEVHAALDAPDQRQLRSSRRRRRRRGPIPGLHRGAAGRLPPRHALAELRSSLLDGNAPGTTGVLYIGVRVENGRRQSLTKLFIAQRPNVDASAVGVPAIRGVEIAG